MPRAFALVVLAALAVTGCRLEPDGPPPSPPKPESREDAGAVPPAPPAAAGDTTRVTPRTAGRPTLPVGSRTAVAASGWAVPVVGVEPGDLVDTFTAARGEGRSHDAIDILAPRGTPVVAAAAGRVARLFTSDRGGLTVYVVGDDGRTVTYYAHLDAYAPGLRAGQRVERGAALGTVGDSGNAAPGNTHLHFAVWIAPSADAFWDGEPVNPYPLLRGD